MRWTRRCFCWNSRYVPFVGSKTKFLTGYEEPGRPYVQSTDSPLCKHGFPEMAQRIPSAIPDIDMAMK
ncbi:hypothetical protein OESDEN_22530 [Oesophagostomum dentatum]|uniref:Uncharacterized protein n=1 Tax=Oesophagostomum dentatum TaxID=61180 RepID=A0A0B1S3Q0_OESDE|nr:hypothetical protein OESDEN_22530 [Oesophagostomum dentatum]